MHVSGLSFLILETTVDVVNRGWLLRSNVLLRLILLNILITPETTNVGLSYLSEVQDGNASIQFSKDCVHGLYCIACHVISVEFT